MNNDEDIQCELKDLINTIHRFCAVNKNKVMFLGGFVAFKDSDEYCEDCGEPIEEMREDGTEFYAYGYLEDLRDLSNFMRDMIEDSADEDGFINV